MRRLLLLALLGLTPGAWAIDLAAVPSEYVSEGITYTRLALRDDKRVVTYVPPALWSALGSTTQLRLTPQKYSRASAVIEAVPLSAEQPLDENTIDVVRQQFVTGLPSTGQPAQLMSEEQNPLLLGGNIPTFEVSASFQALGETFVRSTLFANVAKTQLRFTLTAKKADFDVLHRTFRSSLISWQWSAPQAAGNVAAMAGNTPAAEPAAD